MVTVPIYYGNVKVSAGDGRYGGVGTTFWGASGHIGTGLGPTVSASVTLVCLKKDANGRWKAPGGGIFY